MEHIKAATNLAQRAGSFALSLPEHFDNIFGKLTSGGSIIAEPTSSNIANTTVITSSGTFAQDSLPAGATAAFSNQGSVRNMSPFQTLKNIGGFFSYVTSKWAIATFTTAILLNRTQFYASSRIPLSLSRWHLRLILYILPAIVFLYRIQWLLQAIRCQTSPDWSQLQYGALGKELDTDFAGEGGLLWRISSTLLFWEDEQASCVAANMMPPENDVLRPAGSLAILWPLFISLSFSQFIETLACALESRQPMPETGMTIFEHSLAFAEAEAVVTKPLGLNSSTLLKSTTLNDVNGTSLTLSYSAIIQIANVPSEVLVISLISSLSHLSSNILAIIGLRARLRLISTGIWGLTYMSAFVWSFIRAANIAESSGTQIGILRFPTVCIVGFIPHLLILVGIMACGAIYALAFVLTVLSPPPGSHAPSSLTDRLKFAYRNLQANIHLSTITPIRINWQEDFYTFILKCGFTVLTAASEAVYLNEGTRVTVSPLTWLEEKRLQEVIARRGLLQQTLNLVPAELRGDIIAEGVGLVDQVDDGRAAIYQESGYTRERKTRGANSALDASGAVGRDNGVGLQQRRGRWASTYQFLKGIFWLVIALYSKATIAILQRLRITYRPAWLLRLAGTKTSQKRKARNPGDEDTHDPKTLDFWMIYDDGQLGLPSDTNVDVEADARQRLEDAGFYEQDQEEAEEVLDFNLYAWWKTGGWWGELDTSGDYEALNQDDDATSVVSMATTEEHDWSNIGDNDNGDGQRTPTQESHTYSRDTTPSDELISHLSRLLDPQTREQQEEARLLARHLQSKGVLTRSKYRKAIERDQNRLLTSSRCRPNGIRVNAQSTPEEEEQLLEQFILECRSNTSDASASRSNATWDAGAEGMGSEGPQCVVCQLSPRTILVWPCGCLSLCDDCRIGLASRNYTSCVCCRTNVVAYSRLYVP